MNMIFVVFIATWHILHSAISIKNWLANTRGREETLFEIKICPFSHKATVLHIKLGSMLDKMHHFVNIKSKNQNCLVLEGDTTRKKMY